MYSQLSITALNAEQRAKTCGYWYVVRCCASSHTAFATKAGLQKWLDERGLTAEIPTAIQPENYGKGFSNTTFVEGKYAERYHWDKEVFYALPAVVKSITLENGDYVDAMITQEEGYRTVHRLNPNVRDRKVYPYAETRKEMS